MKEKFEKLSELWGGLSAYRKILLGVAVLGIVALSVGILSWSGGSGDMRVLVSGAEAKDLGEVVDVLKSNQVEFEYSESGDAILVPEESLAPMRMELAMKGLPKSGDVGFEIFDEGNFGISDFVQRTNHTRAIQGELARTISMMDSIRSAKVFVVKPENNLLLSEDPNDRPSASVYVDTGGNTLDKTNVNAIQFLVSRAVKGVNKSNVSVLDNQGNVLSEEGESSGAAGVAGQMMKAYQAQEKRLQDKIVTMLAPIVGGQDKVVARVSVNLDTKSSTMLDEKFDPDGQGGVPRTQTTDKDDAKTVETQQGNNAAGMGANVPNVSQDATMQDPIMAESQEKRESKTTDYEISRKLNETVQEPGAIVGRSAAVLIAKGETPKTPAEIEVIKESVVNAIGARFDDLDLTTHVTVHEVEFLESSTFGVGDTIGQWQSLVDTYGPILKTLLGPLLALVMFIVFLRMFKKFRPSEAEVQVLDEDDQQLLAGTRSLGSGLTPELLNDLIQEKPDNVGTALRRYLETGSSS
jgi:flagellar M-ring protein FliF